jgi:hypothetical protein
VVGPDFNGTNNAAERGMWRAAVAREISGDSRDNAGRGQMSFC